MKDDLISRAGLLRELEFNKHWRYGCGSMEDIDRVMKDVRRRPSVDAVEVIRCKDCEYARPMLESVKEHFAPEAMDCYAGFGFTTAWGVNAVTPQYFCAAGKRKMTPPEGEGKANTFSHLKEVVKDDV
jgi:hypothetical protein